MTAISSLRTAGVDVKHPLRIAALDASIGRKPAVRNLPPFSALAKVVSHGRYVAFQMAEVAIPRDLFAEILRLIAELRPPPVASTAGGVRCCAFHEIHERGAP
jgi:hypothetical protein